MSKMVVVSGGSSGIGLACVTRFAGAGWQVAALDVVSRRHQMPEVMDIWCDVTDEAAVVSAISAAVGEFGAPSAVVNAAGVYPPSSLATVTVDLYRTVFDLNVLGTLLVTRECAAHMEQGAVVNLASVNAFEESVGQLLYGASKAAVMALTRTLAAELAPDIRVNAVAPGWVDTPGARASGRMDAEAVAAIPMGRPATADEIADAVYLLSGAEGRLTYMTGDTITIAGGLVYRT